MTSAPSEDRSSGAPALSDQRLRCALNGSLRTMRTADAQADLNLCWAHRSFCSFCHAVAHIAFDSFGNFRDTQKYYTIKHAPLRPRDKVMTKEFEVLPIVHL